MLYESFVNAESVYVVTSQKYVDKKHQLLYDKNTFADVGLTTTLLRMEIGYGPKSGAVDQVGDEKSIVETD